MRLEPPRIAVLSTHHYVNHGGSEMVVYRATPRRRRVGRARRRRRVSGLSGDAARRSRATRRQGRVLRAALRSGSAHADHRVRARRGRQRSEGQRSSTTCSRSRSTQEPHRDRRQVPRPRRAGDHRALARAENGRAAEPDDLLAGFLKVNGELRRMNADEIAALREEDRADDAVEAVRSCSSATRRSKRRSPTTARTCTRARRSTSRCTSASISRSPQHVPVSRRTRHGGQRELARHLRQLRDHRPRHGRAVALRPLSSFDVKVGDKVDEGPDDRPQRHDRPGRRRSPALHDARQRAAGESGRVVGPALDSGSRRSASSGSGGLAASADGA